LRKQKQMAKGWRWRVLGLTLAVLGLALAVSWAPDRGAESLKARRAPAGSASQFVDVRGMQVHVRDEGPRSGGEPIVLLHGIGDSLHTWEGRVRELSKTRRVIRFGYPGHGLNGPYRGAWLAGGESYAMLNDAKFVVATLEALKVTQPVALGGNSLGAQIAWETADYLRKSQPKRVACLILVDSTGYPFESSAIPMAFTLGHLPHEEDPMQTVAVVKAFLEGI
jgi:pimeloyl-ACP methyl ester carboxylesterase